MALSYGMGDHSPFFKLWYNVLPGVKNFRAPGMALFWLPLLLVMMAGPVLKALAGNDETSSNDRRALLHGTAMYVVLLALAVIARFYWTTFIGPVGFAVLLVYAFACLGVMSLDDQGKAFTVNNFTDAFKSGLPGTHRAVQACVLVGFAVIGVFMMSAQNLLNDPVTAPYFKPLNETVMNMTAGKVIPGFILILVIIAVTWALTKWKGTTPAKAAILAVAAGIELFFIDGAFIQNIPANEYLQPDNGVVKAIKAPFAADTLNTPRVLSLSRSKALGANAFPQYHMRNADGFHDNELATYRAFRGGQGNSNYMLNINDPEAAHPFIDLMNIGAIIFDSRQGTTYMPITTAMGEAYLYGEAVTMSDEDAIKTLQTQAAIRKPKAAQKEVAEQPAENTDEAAAVVTADSAATDSSVVKTEPDAPEFADEAGKFFYREKVILSEKPEFDGKGSVAAAGPIQGSAKLVKSPKMDTQVFKVNASRKGFMVVAGNYHPYWKAYVNGKETKVYKAFGTLRAVEIPEGASEVRMEYRSTPFHACLKVSLVFAILLVALAAGVIVKAKVLAKK